MIFIIVCFIDIFLDNKYKSEYKTIEKTKNKIKIKKSNYKIKKNKWTIEKIYKESDGKVVLLTIDDAPNQYAVDMAKTLKDLKVPAIFFVNGHFLETTEDEKNLKEIHNMGFDIGNHTYSHKSLPDLT